MSRDPGYRRLLADWELLVGYRHMNAPGRLQAILAV